MHFILQSINNIFYQQPILATFGGGASLSVLMHQLVGGHVQVDSPPSSWKSVSHSNLRGGITPMKQIVVVGYRRITGLISEGFSGSLLL